MQERIWFEPLVWMDYRLAVVFTVVIPLVLLIWAFAQKNDTIQRLLIIYWRVSSLLAITVYLMIAALPISFITSLLARVLIPISLWFWVDLNDDLHDQPRTPLKLTLTAWRWAITVYSTLGAIAQVLFLRCAIDRGALARPFCGVWLDPPWLFKEYFHGRTTAGFLGFLGIVGLVFYALCLIYFIFVRLGKQGRSAVQQ